MNQTQYGQQAQYMCGGTHLGTASVTEIIEELRRRCQDLEQQLVALPQRELELRRQLTEIVEVLHLGAGSKQGPEGP